MDPETAAWGRACGTHLRRIDETPDAGRCSGDNDERMSTPMPERDPRAVPRAAARAGARAAASRWMRCGAQRGMVATDGPENRYKDSSRMTHG